MERKQNRDFYLPFAKVNLFRTTEAIKDFLKPAGGYEKPGLREKFLMHLSSKLIEASESNVGPVFSFSGSNLSYPLPSKWLPIINYLKKNKLIEEIFFEQLFHDIPKFFKIHINSPLDKKLTDGRQPSNQSYTQGDSLDLDDALSRVVGEFLERFTLLLYKEEDLIRASKSDLELKKASYLDISNLAGFSEEQKIEDIKCDLIKGNDPNINLRDFFRNLKTSSFQFNKKNDFLWVKGKTLLGGRDILLPAQLVFWNYKFLHKNWTETILRESNTNGAGGYYTLEGAMLSGLYELIQRDGFLIYWLNRHGPPKINLDAVESVKLKSFLAECQRLGFEVNFFNTTSDIGVPSCVCVVFDQSGVGPRIVLGSGSGINWEKILLKSAIEAFSVYHWMRTSHEDHQIPYFRLNEKYQPFKDFSVGQLERLSLWSNGDMYKQFDFFLEGKKVLLSKLKKEAPIFSSEKEELRYLSRKFKSLGNGYEIYYYSAHHKILKDLGYFSVKVIVPALVPLYLREIFAPLEAKRLKEVPKKLGFEPASQFNPLPHLFP